MVNRRYRMVTTGVRGSGKMNQTRQVIVNASAHAVPFPAGFFHACVTSPPYWGLRKYAGEQMVNWPRVEYTPMPGLPPIVIPAQAAALGLEDTPEAYVGHLVLVFRDVRRVLRDDGVCWLNLGDSYAGSWGNYSPGGITGEQRPQTDDGKRWERRAYDDTGWRPPASYYPQGNLLMIPHRVALALQADGWTVRNDNVWAKPGPMPESVAGWRWERCRVRVKPRGRARRGDTQDWAAETGQSMRAGGMPVDPATWTDCPGCPKCKATGGYVLRRGSWRHTRAHEYVFQLTKGMGYFADQERVREGFADERMGNPGAYKKLSAAERKANNDRQDLGFINAGSGWNEDGGKTGRNPRSVFDVTTKPYPGSHYAVFPPDLIAPLIRASVPTRCCPVCGAPWAPVVEKGEPVPESCLTNIKKPQDGMVSVNVSGKGMGQSYQSWKDAHPDQVLGYRPTCDHDVVHDCFSSCRPGWLLDPFVGSGTSLAVARELGVNAVGLDISAVYLDEHAKPRGCGLTPSGALDELPLFVAIEA